MKLRNILLAPVYVAGFCWGVTKGIRQAVEIAQEQERILAALRRASEPSEEATALAEVLPLTAAEVEDLLRHNPSKLRAMLKGSA